MKNFILSAMAIVSLPVAAQTTNCYTYGNSTSCYTAPSHQAVDPNGCGSAATCAMSGYMKARQQQQQQQIQQEQLEQLRLQNEQLRLQNRSMQNRMDTNDSPPRDERPSETEIKAAYCLGALSNSGHALEVELFQNYLSGRAVSGVGRSILDASQRQGEVDRDFAMSHKTQCVTQCAQSGKSIDSCAAVCDAQYASDETERQINSCQGANFLLH